MNRKMDYRLQNYIKEHVTLYIFTLGLFIMGVIFGSLIIYSLTPTQKQELVFHLSNFFHDISAEQQINNDAAFKLILADNIKYLFLLWFLGLSIIGMPLIFILIFLKGFVIGFTVSFLISGLQWKGILFSLVSIIPQNLIIVPVFIIAGVTGIKFSLSLIKSRGTNKIRAYQQTFLSYSFLLVILGGILILASGFESYISPYLIKNITAFVIKP